MPKRSSNGHEEEDVNVLAKRIVEQATGNADDEIAKLLAEAEAQGKNPAAVLLGHFGGLKGGKARAKKLSAKRRSEIAKKAAEKRWSKVYRRTINKSGL